MRVFSIFFFLILSGCASSKVKPYILSNPSTVYPNLPDVTVPSLPQLQTFGFLPPDKSIVGLDIEGYNNLLYNLTAMQAYLIQLKARIDQVNIERKQWRDLNETGK